MGIFAEAKAEVQFYDLDPMQIVWHGNYPRFLELARGALLDRLDYNYPQMAASGYVWPIVDMQIKYVKPARLAQKLTIRATLLEYENRIKIAYRINDDPSGELLTKAQTIQLCVDAGTGELRLDCPPEFIRKVEALRDGA
ncbi:acyl-CoA thioesterase [Bosea caraganae]|uniref:Acyl-CoA thioesterase n=1 Tax=Bosea caraganae TaxID=2763117 RepID=A0A370L848_9HYPH|nr:thioesterase family protein [Bosea caraganae]RDJ25220.1 acyl-CoA thioesterase [Bosea caraganae]RDJ26330.1 acyl-CoA thioesterase [Bosea caraganae]